MRQWELQTPVFFDAAKFLRPFGSKRTEFERQIRQNLEVAEIQYENAASPMLVTEFGIVTEVAL